MNDLLYNWYKEYARDLPWRFTRDAYSIWLSEIILQQTRVDQGMPYYQRFIETYPKVCDLAGASEQEILRLWQGLGYYSRARNLHRAAQIVCEAGGVFPKSYADLIELPGIGDYTAAAIASFSSGERVPVVDGNVFRVLARLFAIDSPIDKANNRKLFKSLSLDLMGEDPALHNQAMMEFGALQCTPRNPNCTACPLNDFCQANAKGLVDQLPVKAGKTKVKPVYFDFLHIQRGERLYLQKRDDTGIWKNMFQFPLLSAEEPISQQHLISFIDELQIPTNTMVQEVYSTMHLLSHRRIHARIFKVDIEGEWEHGKKDIFDIDASELEQYPIPKLIDRYLERKQ